jgi:hypothetical protein
MSGPNSEQQYSITQSELERIIARAVAVALREHQGLNALGGLLVEASHVTKAKDLSPKTISQNKKVTKYNAKGHRKLLMKLEDVDVIQNRKRGDK